MSLLAEFPQSVVDSHAWIVAESLAGERLSHEIILQLGAEVLSVEKIAVLTARQVVTVLDARKCWQSALECFETSANLWTQLPIGDPFVESHARLLNRLCGSAGDMMSFYDISSSDRSAYQKRKAEPRSVSIAVAESSNGAASF
jgi:hypothetical protein